ncbi:hypothetical protein [Paenibacillus solani]|uniref:Uncharacterized protein n=1 Tax=Paenibacillus solani TaxID=1705565 RepID=A0A0M1P0R2_9BACL|nr:hypothetical protein [Paenibacillus solani]KOR88051.1 hypothetical protein AM231_02105 [Paenibacillus solani]
MDQASGSLYGYFGMAFAFGILILGVIIALVVTPPFLERMSFLEFAYVSNLAMIQLNCFTFHLFGGVFEHATKPFC